MSLVYGLFEARPAGIVMGTKGRVIPTEVVCLKDLPGCTHHSPAISRLVHRSIPKPTTNLSPDFSPLQAAFKPKKLAKSEFFRLEHGADLIDFLEEVLVVFEVSLDLLTGVDNGGMIPTP